jgi:hypothetical protein
MDPALRIIRAMPLSQLWDSSGRFLPLQRGRDLSEQDIASLLRSGLTRIVVANCGDPLEWVPLPELYIFWKGEVKPRLWEPSLERCRLEDFPGEYCYGATEWTGDGGPVILLEKYH